MSMKTVLKKLTSMVLVICMFVSLAAPAVGDAPLPQPTEEAVLPDGTTVYADGSLVYADGTIVYADGTTVRADGTTADANGTVVYPDGTMLYADGKMVYANGTAVYPDGTTVYADGTVFYPDGTIVYADGTTVRADGVTVNPDGTTVYPDGTTIYTDGTIVYADGTRAYPDGTVVYADGTTLNPDGTTVYPDGTTVYADGTTLKPDGSTVYPDGTTVYADGTTLKPDGTTVYPDGTTVYADGTTLKPDGTTVYPDGTTVYADGTTLTPDGITVYPDGTKVYADGTTVYPDGTKVYADGTTVYPDGTTVYPEGSTEPVPEEEPVIVEEPEVVIPDEVPEIPEESPEETPADPVIPTDSTTAEETQHATDPATDVETEEITEPVTEGDETETQEAGEPEEDEENKTEETSEETAEKTTEETAEGTTEETNEKTTEESAKQTTEQTTEEPTEETAEETADAAPAEELPLRTLTVSADQMAFRDQFLNPKEPVLWSGSVWSALYGTAIEPVYTDGHVIVEISGHLPETVTARAMFVEFADPGAAQNDERALMLLDVALLDETGAFYVPAEALHVSVSDASVYGAVANGEPFAAYFDDAYDGLGDAGDVRVGLDDNIDGDRLAYIPGLRDTLLFWEAGDRLISTENGTVDFDSNRFPFRFVLSAQQEPREEAQPEVLPDEQNSDEQPAEQQNAVKDVTLSGTLVASDGYTYEVSVSYPADCGLPVGAELSVEELIVGTDAYWDYINQSAAELGVSPADLSLARAFDISLVDPATGVHYQPTKDVQVSILLISTPVNTEEEISVLHFDDEAGAVQPMDVALNGEAIEFETGGFSVYVVLQRVIEKTLTASDGNTYQITVDYDSASGIPNGVELNVQELLPGTEQYLNYIAHCAAELGLEAESFSLARAFDISLVDPATGITYQPNKNVKVSVQLLDQQVDEEAPVDVLHFGEEVETVDCALNGEAVEFAANGFSVYVILQHVIEKTLTASDGNTYHITVDYDSASGIPNGVELNVQELLPDTDEYRNYIAQSAEELGLEAESISLARAFDISLVDPATGTAYQPNKDVKVSVQLLDQQVDEEAPVDVLHFGEEVEMVDCALNGEAVEFAANGFSVYVILQRVIEKTLTASDGNTYRITVDYDSASGIPNGVELNVQELLPDSDEYRNYIAQSAEKLSLEEESFSMARAFDISLVDPATGTAYQPNKDVKVSIELLDRQLNEEAQIDVLHFGDEVETMDCALNGEAIEFTANGFSVYVIIEHEGGKIVTPRVEFHFIDRYTDEQYSDGIDVTQETTAAPYNFVNTNGDYQTTQILTNGEALELISDPSSISVSGIEKFFYGWYVVTMNSDDSSLNSETGKYTGEISFNWPASPDQIRMEQAITIIANDENGDGKITVPDEDESSTDDTLTWTLKDVTGTGTMDRSGTVHVYLAPLYEDFYFLNFHSGPRDSSATASSLMTRKLVVFGSGESASVRIGNVICESPDPQHKIFSGWEADINRDESIEDSEYFQTVHHIQDAEGNLTNEEVNSTGSSSGYYITVTKSTSQETYLDLYPVFDEARWLYFDRGVSGNGASYVGASYRLTNDDRTTEDTFYYFDDAFFTGNDTTVTHLSTRPGYAFKGWYLFANVEQMDEETKGDITNLNTAQNYTLQYLDSDGNVHDTTINTKAIQVVDENGHIQDIGTWYVSSSGEISQTDASGSSKLFEVDREGYLRFYKAMNEMTLSARWVAKPTTYRVIIWKQKVTDDKNAPDAEKTYDFEIFYTSGNVSDTVVPDLTHFTGSYVDANNVTRTVNNINLLNRSYTGFHYARNDVGTRTPEADGTTVYNVYYDRNLLTIRWRNGSNAQKVDGYEYAETTSSDLTPQFGWVNGGYVELAKDGNNWIVPQYGYKYVENGDGGFVKVGDEYVPLVPVTEETTTYTADYRYNVSSNNNATYILIDGEYISIEQYNGNWYRQVGTANYGQSDDLTYQNGQTYYYRQVNWGNVSYSQLYYNNNRWRTYDYDINVFNHTGSIYQRFTGTRYTRIDDDVTDVTNNVTLNTTEFYYIDGNGGKVPVTAHTTTTMVGYKYDNNGTEVIYTNEQRYSYDYTVVDGTPYTGTRYIRSNNVVTQFTGLYGQRLAQYGYSWPSNYLWFSQTNSSGNRLTFLDAFLFDNLAYASQTNYPKDTLTLYRGTQNNSRTVYFFIQNLDGSYSNTTDGATNSVAVSSNSNFTITDKYNGFTADSYSTNNGATFTKVTYNATNNNYGSVSTDNNPWIRFRRNEYDLTFDVNYPVDANLTYSKGTSDNMSVTLLYGAPLDAYGPVIIDGMTHWYYGTVDSKNTAEFRMFGPDHYTFEGWYEDKSCRMPFNFNSTITSNKIVYAKWEPVKFIIQIDPNGGEQDHVDHRGYSSFGSGTVTINGQSYPYDFTTINSNYSPMYPLNNAGNYNVNALQTYIRSSYGSQLTLYDPARRFVAMNDRVAAEYVNGGGTVYYYMNYQWKSTDGASGIYQDVRSALYLTEAQLRDFYNLYWNIVVYSMGLHASSNEGMTLLDYDTWCNRYVYPYNSNNMTKYRPTNSNETWTFLGWFKTPINEDGSFGTEESMPYNINDPVTGSFKLTAHWRLDGGYSIRYVPTYTMEDGAKINGNMTAWRDPINSDLTYADGAVTEIYKDPTGLTKNDQVITDDSVIFRGWALVSKTGTDENPVYTPLETDAEGNITTYYFPSDSYTVNAANAGTDSTIYLQAVYQYKQSSERRPEITNLTLDANTGYVNTSESKNLPPWSYPGTHAINTVDHLDSESRPTQILFGDIQSSAAVHLYQYATEITEAADGVKLQDAHQFFTHPNDWFLLGFDDSATEGDYIATYPADSAIAVTRDDNKTLYAVWEPMVFVTFVNNTGVTANDLTFGISSSAEAMQVINVVNGLYERTPLSDYGNITLKDGESITLAFPKGAEETLTVSGTNTLGVGKKLIWNSSLDLVENDTTTSYSTVGSAATVDYNHTYEGATHTHTLVSGQVNNTKPFSFDETMIINKNPLTVTFTSVNNDYALLLIDNYPGGSVQEIDYAKEDIEPDTSTNPATLKSQVLPTTSTRVGYSFVGWAEEPNATVPDYSASTPAGSPWTITDLNHENGGFFSTAVEEDGVLIRRLYAVWEAKTDAIYVYKEVPEPGNQEQAFMFTVSITATYKYGRDNKQRANINKSQTFKLIHGEYLKISSANNSANPGDGVSVGDTKTAFLESLVEVYKPVTDPVTGITSDVKVDARSGSLRWEQDVPAYNQNGFEDLKITVTETPVNYYGTSVTLSSQKNPESLLPFNSNGSDLPKTVSTSSVYWRNTDDGGTMVFVNQRQTYDVKVEKTLESNTSTQAIFNYSASYTDSYVNLEGTTVTTTKDLEDFTVTSGGSTTLNDIPAGVNLTITEATDASNNYKTYVLVDKGSEERESKSCSAFTVGVNPADVANKTHTVAFRNVLKSYPVTFKLVDQDGNTSVNGMFSLASSIGSLGTDLYASATSVKPPAGVFYTSNKFWADTYTLSQTTIPTGYIGLSVPVTLNVTGKEGEEITSDSEFVTVSGDAKKGFVITVTNWKTVDISLRAGLLDPMVSQRTFVYSGTYKLTVNGKTNTYDLNRNLLADGDSPATTNLIAYSTEDGSVSSRHEPKTFAIPVQATELTILEDISQVTSEPETIGSTYDVYVSRNSEDRVRNNSYSFDAAISADENANDVITFYNEKKTVNITVKKAVVAEDPAGTFSFTAGLFNDGIPITGYPVFINGTKEDTSDDRNTDGNGAYVFTLRNYAEESDAYILTVPVGAKLTIRETGVEENNAGNDLNLYETAVSATVTSTNPVTEYSGTTEWDEANRLFTLNAAPSTLLTVTFTNTINEGERKVILRKVSSADYSPIVGPTFTVYKGSSTTPFTVKHDDGTTEILKNLPALSSGVFWIGDLPYGWYIVKETAPARYFYIVVTESGVYEKHAVEFVTIAAAQAAAEAKYNEMK